MKFSKNHFIFISIFLSLILLSKLGIISYDSFTESHFKFISQGYFFNDQPGAMVNTFGCYIFLGDLFKFISINYGLHVFDFFIILSISLLFYNTYLLVNESKNKLPLYLKIGIYALIVAIVFQVESIKIAILLSGISTLLFLYKSQFSILKKTYYIACIILGLMIRIEGGALSIIFICLVYFVFTNKSKVLFLKLTIVILPIILLYARVNTPMNLKESEYLELRPYQFSLWDFNKNQKIDFKSTKDSTIYNTTLNFFLSDKDKMNPEYFKKNGVLKNDKSPADFIKTLSQKSLNTSDLHIDVNKQLLLGIFAISFLFIIIFSKQKIQVAFVWISGLATLFIIWFLMKMELRVLDPFLLMIFLYSIYIGQIQVKQREQKFIIIYSILLLFISFITLFQYYSHQKSIANSMEKTIVYLNDLPQNSKIIVNLHPLVSWNNTILKKNPVLNNKYLLSIDNGLFFLQESYDQYLLKLYGSTDYNVVFMKIANDSSTYFVSNSERMNLLSNYAQDVYGIKWNYTSIKKIRILENDIYVYQFNK